MGVVGAGLDMNTLQRPSIRLLMSSSAGGVDWTYHDKVIFEIITAHKMRSNALQNMTHNVQLNTKLKLQKNAQQ